MESIPWGDKDPVAVQRAIEANFRQMHEDAAEGKRTRAEIKEAAEKASRDLIAIDQRLGTMAAEAAAASRGDDGPASELRMFVQKDGASGASQRVHLTRRRISYRGQTMEPVNGLLDCDATYGDWHREVKQLWEGIQYTVAVKRQEDEPKNSMAVIRRHAPKSFLKMMWLLESRAPVGLRASLAPQVERIFTDTDGVGGEFIPDEVRIPELERDLRLGGIPLLTDSIARRQTSTVNLVLPFVGTGAIPYLYGYATSDTPAAFAASTPSTAERSVNIKGLAARLVMDRDAIEDSIVDAVPEMRAILARTLQLGLEDAFINGDTAATHQDSIASWNPNGFWASSGMGGAGDHRRGLLGLKARAYDIGSTAKLDLSAGLSYAEVLQLAALLSVPHGVDGDLVLAVSHQAYLEDILGLAEVATVDKYGSRASVLSGEVGKVGPFSIVKTPLLTNDLANTGLYTGSGALSAIVAFNRGRYVLYERMGVVVELEVERKSGIVHLIVRLRVGLHNRDHGSTVDSSAVRNVAVGYNL